MEINIEFKYWPFILCPTAGVKYNALIEDNKWPCANGPRKNYRFRRKRNIIINLI